MFVLTLIGMTPVVHQYVQLKAVIPFLNVFFIDIWTIIFQLSILKQSLLTNNAGMKDWRWLKEFMKCPNHVIIANNGDLLGNK